MDTAWYRKRIALSLQTVTEQLIILPKSLEHFVHTYKLKAELLSGYYNSQGLRFV